MHFCMNSVVSKQNVEVWGVERPDEQDPVDMNRAGIMTWGVISK